ncbi:MAG TPA: MOSC N-terminal beta barrel domain-containing protein [Candidatus Polarisedimenticolia bacterium]|nr:MOSC N-terminal beta barrel domain-containing protein [Candidatus Polarisedimenticolia bacterium]
MRIAGLWRYPIKSMAGERVQRADLHLDGIEGDRVVQVRDARGRVLTARTHPKLLGHRATLGPDGEPLVDGRPWRSDEVARDVVAAAGGGARLVRADPEERFDVLPLLVATDGAIEAFGYDGRRLRPNIVIAGVEGLAERRWERRALRAGTAFIGLHSLRARCVMTTYDPDTLDQDVGVLRHIQESFDGKLALNAYVIREGVVAVGDEAVLQDREEG